MNKNNFPIYLSISLIFGIIIGAFLNGNSVFDMSLSKKSPSEAKIKRLINFIQKDYVDTISTDSLLDNAIVRILEKLDPHSIYIPKENLQAVTENMQGNFAGIGIQFRMINDSITVIHPIKGGPSIKAGIQSGDRILIAGKDTLFGKDIKTAKILPYLKGKVGTKIKLKIYRKTNDSLFTTEITRANINIKSVDIAYMINDSIGYIKLDRFARNTYSEFKTSLKNLLKNGMTDLVLDIRGNSGGYIDVANKIADEFLEENKLIVFTKDNKGKKEEIFATKRGEFEKGGLYILIDEGSASASEIIAGALQDNDKGTIIGRRSFGKGLVQEEMNLGDGSAVRLTIARYYTPTGRSIQKSYSNKKNKDYYADYLKRITSGELINKDSIPIVDSLQYKTPKGKIVYGGGGIIPDVFVPIDTSSSITNTRFISINNFAFNYVDSNRKEISNRWTLEKFVENFDKDKKILNKYYLNTKKGKPASRKIQKTIRKYLKASIADELFGDIGFYKIMHKDDKMLRKVLMLEKESVH